eukprot:306804_1
MPEPTGEKSNSFCLNHAKLRIEKGGYFKSKSYIFSIDGCDLLTAVSTGMLHTGTFRVSTRDLETLSTTYTRSKTTNKSWRYVGHINSPGILFDRSIISDDNANVKAAIIYRNTSRTGDLMNMKVIIPKVNNLSEKHLIKTIATSTVLPKDCAQIIAEYCPLHWTENMSNNITPSNCHKLIDKSEQMTDKKVVMLRNKLPVWNAQINAYTLEFGGRALVPSVHNFQLIDDKNHVVLQLGKINEAEFNVDFSFPLSPYQAVGICLSVIDRTFVWD